MLLTTNVSTKAMSSEDQDDGYVVCNVLGRDFSCVKTEENNSSVLYTRKGKQCKGFLNKERSFAYFIYFLTPDYKPS